LTTQRALPVYRSSIHPSSVMSNVNESRSAEVSRSVTSILRTQLRTLSEWRLSATVAVQFVPWFYKVHHLNPHLQPVSQRLDDHFIPTRRRGFSNHGQVPEYVVLCPRNDPPVFSGHAAPTCPGLYVFDDAPEFTRQCSWFIELRSTWEHFRNSDLGSTHEPASPQCRFTGKRY